MIIYFVIGNLRGTFSTVNMLKGYMLIVEMLKEYMLTSWNAEGVHGQRMVGNPCSTQSTRCRYLVSERRHESRDNHYYVTVQPTSGHVPQETAQFVRNIFPKKRE